MKEALFLSFLSVEMRCSCGSFGLVVACCGKMWVTDQKKQMHDVVMEPFYVSQTGGSKWFSVLPIQPERERERRQREEGHPSHPGDCRLFRILQPCYWCIHRRRKRKRACRE